jgi:hypothetical protein
MQSVCFEALTLAAVPQHSEQPRDLACLEEIDAALQAAPASGELWLFKASTLASAGTFGKPMITALRNAYRTAPTEGWIVSDRVILGLRLFPALSEDLQLSVRSDLNLVLHDARLARPLIDAYLTNAALRSSAETPIRDLPADAMNLFVQMARTEATKQ